MLLRSPLFWRFSFFKSDPLLLYAAGQWIQPCHVAQLLSKTDIDLAVFGSSLATCALPEDELSQNTGLSVCSLATNMQSWDMTEIAVDTILQEHHPKTAILVMDYYNMGSDPYPKAQYAFLYGKLETAPVAQIPSILLRYMTGKQTFSRTPHLTHLFLGKAALGLKTGKRLSHKRQQNIKERLQPNFCRLFCWRNRCIPSAECAR